MLVVHVCVHGFENERERRGKPEKSSETETEWPVIWFSVLHYFCSIGSVIFSTSSPDGFILPIRGKVTKMRYCEQSPKCHTNTRKLLCAMPGHKSRQVGKKERERERIPQLGITGYESWLAGQQWWGKVSASSHKMPESHMGQTMGCCITPTVIIIYTVSEHHPNPKKCMQLIMI